MSDIQTISKESESRNITDIHNKLTVNLLPFTIILSYANDRSENRYEKRCYHHTASFGTAAQQLEARGGTAGTIWDAFLHLSLQIFYTSESQASGHPNPYEPVPTEH